MEPHDIELFAAIRRVVGAFDHLRIDYFIGGSVASSVLGEPRQTLDADLIAAVLGRHAGPLVELLQDAFYIDSAMILSAIEHQSQFNLIQLETMVKVDVYVSWRSDFAKSQFKRRLHRNIDENQALEVFLASPEDTVLSKLDWFRIGQGISDRQWRDVLGVLKIQANALDRAYLREWAGKLGLSELLRRAIDDAGLPPIVQ